MQFVFSNCAFGQVCTTGSGKFKPEDYNDKIDAERFEQQLQDLKPNIIIWLGKDCLSYLGIKHPLDDWRGSLFEWRGFKSICSYEPLTCFSDPTFGAILRFDLRRAVVESSKPELLLPSFNITVAYDIGTALSLLNTANNFWETLSFDVEGWPDEKGISCISFANNQDAFVIPLRHKNGSSVFSLDDECLIWQSITQLLQNPRIKKTAQNAGYDLFVLAWSHKLVVKNLQDDTMCKHWEMYPEFPKNLGFLTSIYTRHPYFKSERTDGDEKLFFEYNGKDSIVTQEVNNVLEQLLKQNPESYKHYRFNVKLLYAYLYMQLKGCKIDVQLLNQRRYDQAVELQKDQQAFSEAVGFSFNPKSSKQKAELLYQRWLLPLQYQGRGESKKVTTNEEALLNLAFSHGEKHPELRQLIEIIRKRTFLSDGYKLEPFPDGRIRSNFNIVGTDTGRLTSSATSVKGPCKKLKWKFTDKNVSFSETVSIDFLGTNLQNVTEDWRDVFIPDPGYLFWNVDLTGADAWTVAADLASVGYPTMLEDLKFGIKPSLVTLMLLHEGKSVNSLSRQEIKARQNEYKKDAAMYLCAKRMQHGTNYGMKANKVVELVFKDSNGSIRFPLHIAEQMQQLYSYRYNITARHELCRKRVQDRGSIQTAAGVRRQFFKRRGFKVDDNLLREIVASEPQTNTTYGTNLALERLFYSPENRQPDNTLKVQPLIMVHDALSGQFPENELETCKTIIQKAFDISLTISGIDVKIPYEFGIGKNWKDCKNNIIT